MDTGRVPRTRSLRSPVSPIFLALVVATVAGAALTLLQPPGDTEPAPALVGGTILFVLAGWAVSLCLHEFSHAFVADRCGDHSVRAMGYLTLDIRRYANVGLTIVLPLLFLLIGGIPLPGGAVWIQRGALRSRLAQSAVSAAGPAANLVLAVVLTVVLAQVTMPVGLAAALSFFVVIQLLTCVLNLLPVPGLDGFGVLDPYLPYALRLRAARVAPYAPLVILVALFFLPGVAGVVFTPAYALFAAMGGDADLASTGAGIFLSLVRGG